MGRFILPPSKGQAFLPDFLSSVVIFGFVLMIFIVSWNTIIDNQVTNQQDRELYNQGQRMTNQLITYSGKPESWNSSNVEVVGFAERPNILNSTKIDMFDSLSYEDQKSLMRAVGGFQISISEDDSVLYDIGSEPDGDRVFSFNRYSALNKSGELRRVEVTYSVW